MIKMLRLSGAVLAGALILLAATDGLRAQSAGEYREQINSGTVGIISGGVDGTYIRIATDLAAVLDNGDDLRVLPVMGKGSVQNIDDILYLRGIDIGIVQSDVFEFVRRQGKHSQIDNRINYITKLYNEEFHLLARKEITQVADLAGKKVNFGVQGSGTYMTASLVFELLGIEPEPVSFDQALALESLVKGEIDGLIYVAGKPTRLFRDLSGDQGVHFLPIPLEEKILDTYFPSRLTNADYPGLVPEGEPVRTVAVGAVMAVYNWAEGGERHRKVSRFIDAFFSSFDSFLQAPRHRKWQEVSLAAEVPGWNRFEPAARWLANNSEGATQNEDRAADFARFLEEQAPDVAARLSESADQQELLELFEAWRANAAEQ